MIKSYYAFYDSSNEVWLKPTVISSGCYSMRPLNEGDILFVWPTLKEAYETSSNVVKLYTGPKTARESITSQKKIAEYLTDNVKCVRIWVDMQLDRSKSTPDWDMVWSFCQLAQDVQFHDC